MLFNVFNRKWGFNWLRRLLNSASARAASASLRASSMCCHRCDMRTATAIAIMRIRVNTAQKYRWDLIMFLLGGLLPISGKSCVTHQCQTSITRMPVTRISRFIRINIFQSRFLSKKRGTNHR